MQNLSVLVATDVRLAVRCGRIFAKVKHATILERYFKAFGQLIVFSRTQDYDGTEKNYVEITHMIKYLISAANLESIFLGRYNAAVSGALAECGLVIARCPSIAAYRAADCARSRGIPVFAEVMGCAWDAYVNHGALGKIIAPYMFLKMRSVLRNADYALYVTSAFLQGRYPCPNESVSASNVLLSETDSGALKRRIEKIKRTDFSDITLVTVGAADVRHKGQQYVIKALPVLERMGIRARYKVVGEGKNGYLKSVAKFCGVSDRVEFLGTLNKDEIFKVIDDTDIYIQPSLQEGLPRAVIEAMSRGAPVLGTDTAGIPELVTADNLFKRKNSRSAAESIARLCRAPTEHKIELAKNNFEISKKYSQKILDRKRCEYFQKICLKSGDLDAHGFEYQSERQSDVCAKSKKKNFTVSLCKRQRGTQQKVSE